MKRMMILTVLLGVLLMFAVSCSDNDSSTSPVTTEFDSTYVPDIDPANFVSGITNPYMPLTVGKTFIYEGEDEEGESVRIELYVTSETKVVMGVTCTIVREREWIDGELEEDTDDWFAQDVDGNVWYFGEDSKEIDEGQVVSTEGSWEAGVDGAQPGILMKANPQTGESYRQEYYHNEAEDMALVLSLSASVTVPYGSYTNVLQTEEWTPLEPGVSEHKYYASGVGLLKEEGVTGESGYVELISITTE